MTAAVAADVTKFFLQGDLMININREQLTPMMKQYLLTKEDYEDCILFYRLGDFYEMFFDDALTASRELEITLTGKSCGLEERAPMCGVPFHSANVYIAKLVSKGYKVAICEQTENPKEAKGLVKREVIRIVTPGTIIEEGLLDEKRNNYLGVVYRNGLGFGLAFSDVSTGEIYATCVKDFDSVINETARYSPSEIIMNEEAHDIFAGFMNSRFHVNPQKREAELFESYTKDEKLFNQFKKETLAELGLSEDGPEACAVYAMVCYLEETQKGNVVYMDTLQTYSVDEYMDIDVSTRRNLEITETMREKQKRGSLLWVLDKTKTSMGARKLKQWMEKPLVNPAKINKRLYSVEELYNNRMLKDDLAEILSGIYDVARICARVSLFTVNPRDLVSLRSSLLKLPEFYTALSKAKSPLLSEIYKRRDAMEDICSLLCSAITEEPPVSVKDGGVIKDGYSEEIDNLRTAMTNGKQWIAAEEAAERERTGIKNLRIQYNKVFGYYIEVTKSNLKDVPQDYIRKQTLTNCERFITPRLKELEELILGAAEKVNALEEKLFEEIRKKVAGEIDRLKDVCEAVASVDVLYSFAEVAYKNNYTMPVINAGGSINIKNGRHPVVEKTLKDTMFVANDTWLDKSGDRMLIITGPNMAGKSTYMRQVAVITLMAQVGSFVPADSAEIGVVDKIFTRVGASDDIAAGQSTFMLEMTEVANILKNATADSLVILDEIGRGTSTFDGLSIAWAVAEYMHDRKKIGAKTLFATHYHEMSELEGMLDGVKNYRIAVKKRGDDITFLRKIVRGGADESYGIEVAALAGVPGKVIKRAKEILNDILSGNTAHKEKDENHEASLQMGFTDMAAAEILEELKNIDATTYTPIEALNKLYELSKRAKEF